MLAGDAERRIVRTDFLRAVAQRSAFLAASLLGGFLVGLGYRFLLDEPSERVVANYLRSGLHGAGLGLTVWAVQTAYGARFPVGAALRRLPLAADVILRTLVMTAALTIVGVSLQFVLYRNVAETWLTARFAQDRRNRLRVLDRRRRHDRDRAAGRRRASGERSSGNLSSPRPAAADRDVPRPRQFDAPRRGDGRASRSTIWSPASSSTSTSRSPTSAAPCTPMSATR